MGKPIVMGRKTYESIGRPLPGRQNIVVTRNPDFAAEGCDVVASVEAAIEAAGDAEEIMVIGGSHIYEAFLPGADRIYLTRVQAEVEGDAYLPELSRDGWIESAREVRAADESNDHDVIFSIFECAGPDS